MLGVIKKSVRGVMSRLAGPINQLFRGRLRPAHITALSLTGHFPVVWALVTSRPILAAVLLAVFSLLDAFDGALAREQKSSSRAGMYFDAVSDRAKEVLVFSGLAVFASKHIDSQLLWQVVAVCGTSLLVSYTKAKGEMAVAGTKSDPQTLNRVFEGGISSYEVRTLLVVIALLLGVVEIMLSVLLVLNLLTIVVRFMKVSKHLKALDLAEKVDPK